MPGSSDRTDSDHRPPTGRHLGARSGEIRRILREELDAFAERQAFSGPPRGRYLTVPQVADMLNLSVRSVEDLVAMKEIPVADIGPHGGKRVVARNAVEAYVQSQTRT